MVARAFPAWVMGRSPHKKFIVSSYGHEVAEQNGVACRKIMKSDWYQRCFPETLISAELDRNTHFETTKAGQYYAASALAPVTGIGCFVAGTFVSTTRGLIPIEKLRPYCKSDTLCLSYNHDREEYEYKEITDWTEQTTSEIFEIRTHFGYSFRCTPNHRVYVWGRGYVRAERASKKR